MQEHTHDNGREKVIYRDGPTAETNPLEANKALVVRFFEEVFNRANLGAVDQLFGASYVEHSPMPGQSMGKDGLDFRFKLIRNAFPDIQMSIEDVIAEGDKVVARWRTTATHRGAFFGVPATGRKVTNTGIAILTVSDNKITAHWGEGDWLGLMQQLGAVP